MQKTKSQIDMTIQYTTTATDFIKCFEVMKELRPHHNPESFITAMEAMQKEGYHLLYLEDEGRIVSGAGFGFTTTLYDGLIIDFDDFVTVADGRSKGYGAKVFDHLVEVAKEKGIKAIHLNSAHHRYDAHRFYLNKKMKIIAHHFRLDI
jgi:GNAT superfamily N-acetyltransferase